MITLFIISILKTRSFNKFNLIINMSNHVKIIIVSLLCILLIACNKEKSTTPIITTAIITGIFQTTAISGGNVTNDGEPPIVSRGICWDTSFNPTVNNAWCRYMSYDDVARIVMQDLKFRLLPPPIGMCKYLNSVSGFAAIKLIQNAFKIHRIIPFST
jgi:hypothetical protein